MVTFRSLDNLAQAMLDFLRTVQPDLDTKPGAVARDLFVDLPASEIAKLYVELKNVSNLQSIASATGNELDKLARNFGLARKSGSLASGIVVFTINTLDGSILIPAGTLVTARNGISYKTLSDAQFDSSKANIYRANATRMRTDLSLAGITDEFALEATVEATSFGTAGNIGRYGIVSQSVSGVSNITNITSFSGGSGVETDDQFRNRTLAIFAGSNLGTALGYENSIKTDSRVVDVLTVEPGDTLMTRDGTQTTINQAGEPIIISSGTGGKVDIYVQGAALEEISESYIYKDLSGKNNPTSSANDYTIGQRSVNPLLDYQQKRRLLFAEGTLPFQPVDSIVSINGSSSGPNFIEKFVDTDGTIKGNFELDKDVGAFGGSVFGFDKIHFISKNISLTDEGLAKGIHNGQDGLDYTDVSSIESVYEDVIVSNENSSVSSSDRSIITLNHTPVVTVDRVVNITTGDRYVVTNQNPDGVAGELNTTGRIKISGSSLPSPNHILQVNYIWKNEFDSHIDYDNLSDSNPIRTVQDSIDWGFGNRVIAEQETVVYSIDDGYHVITELPISRVVNVNQLLEETLLKIDGKITASNPILDITSIKDANDNEVYYTAKSDGSFSGFEVTLPSDSLLADSDLLDSDGYVYATIRYNSTDLYSPDGYDTGSFSGNVIHLADDITTIGSVVYVDYIADISNLIANTPLTNLPATGLENQFLINSVNSGNQPVTNIYDSNGNVIKNLRFSPTFLKLNVSGISATGRLQIKGSSFTKVDEIITIRRNGLQIDLSDAIKAALNTATVTSTSYVALLESVERVTVVDDTIVTTDFVFDVLNYSIKTNTYSNSTARSDSSLSNTEVLLRATESNTGDSPTTGEKLRVVFYVIDTSAVERLTVSAGGTIISHNKYAYVDKIAIDSGFVGLSATVEGSLLVDSYTQPSAGISYFASYDYIAPKEGERLTIKYRYNKLISDLMFLLEDSRPITADVLIKSAIAKPIDVELSVVVTSNFANNTANLQQGLQETLTSFLSANGLNTTVDQSDIINASYGVSGVDRIIVTKFNLSGSTGVVKSISAGRNEYITAGTIIVNIESR